MVFYVLLWWDKELKMSRQLQPFDSLAVTLVMNPLTLRPQLASARVIRHFEIKNNSGHLRTRFLAQFAETLTLDFLTLQSGQRLFQYPELETILVWWNFTLRDGWPVMSLVVVMSLVASDLCQCVTFAFRCDSSIVFVFILNVLFLYILHQARAFETVTYTKSLSAIPRALAFVLFLCRWYSIPFIQYPSNI